MKKSEEEGKKKKIVNDNVVKGQGGQEDHP
jgi:hypothetical protein